MTCSWRHLLPGTTALLLGVYGSGNLAAQSPTAAQALKLVPVQKADVVFDLPPAADLEKCTIKSEKVGPSTGWIVRSSSGQILREFVDTNKDNVVDRWSYYQDGIEVYRDIDENFDGKADQHRWLNTAGTRWGLDKNQDGQIDAWKSISPEEVTAELVAAIRDKNAARFQRLLLSQNELTSLGLGSAKAREVAERLGKAPQSFAVLAKTQTLITDKTNWVDFGGSHPGIVPAGTDESASDLITYENAVAMLDTAGKSGQLQVGTLVRVGDVWRILDVPATEPNQAATGTFFANPNRVLSSPDQTGNVPNEALSKLMDESQKLDAELGKATEPAELAQLHARRADLLEKIAAAAEGKDRGVWQKQLADALSTAVQAGAYPDGLTRLQKLAEKLAQGDDSDTAGFAKYRFMQAEYALSLQAANPDYAKIQTAWLEKLEKFVADFPQCGDAADALLQLGNAEEFAGQEEKAKTWYLKIVTDFPDSPTAKKARGAVTRLDCVGRPITLTAKALGGNATVDLARYKGKTVLIHYWATWCEPCKVDMAQLKELQAKFGKQGFELIGVNLDEKTETAVEFLTANRLPWAQLHEPGGLESRLANEMGILNLPTMLLIDETGKVANRGIHITELDSELRKKFKLDQAARPMTK